MTSKLTVKEAQKIIQSPLVHDKDLWWRAKGFVDYNERIQPVIEELAEVACEDCAKTGARDKKPFCGCRSCKARKVIAQYERDMLGESK